jgi:FtsP/CotA-like multicopper oxidase with cupredoxin domain
VRAALVALLLLTSGLAGCVGTAEDATPTQAGPPPLTPIDRSTKGLDEAQPSQRVELSDGDSFELSAGYVEHDPGTGDPIRMMAYNGQIPGPELHLKEGAQVDVTFTNELDVPTTVHWHGLRLDNANDGVPNLTQQPVQPGESFEYTIEVPDAGVFWYHPHVRTDVQKELGLYGAIVVDPPKNDTDVYPEESVLHLDDIRLAGGDVPEMYEEAVTFADSGRWGNTPFVNGTESANIEVGPDERHRLHLVNPSNARTWRLDFQGFASVEKIAAGPSYLEQPREIDKLRLGPAERATIDVEVDADSSARIVDEPTTWTLARVVSSLSAADPGGLAAQQTPSGPHERARAEDRGGFLDQEPDREIHLRMVRNETVPPDPNASDGDGHGDHDHGAPEPALGEVNPLPTDRELEWLLVDQDTGEVEPNYEFEVGDVVRFTVDIVHQHGQGGDHAAHSPVPHPIHLHGQRFMVENYGDREPAERVWKDTVLANDPVRDHQSATFKVEMSNPGTWLVHCHISEHSEAGMTAVVNVTAPS